MENPFELIVQKLNTIENLLRTAMKPEVSKSFLPEVINIDEASDYVHLSKSTIYKQTSERTIPHFKRGKKLYFKRSELDEWLTTNKVDTQEENEKKAIDYIIRKGKIKFK